MRGGRGRLTVGWWGLLCRVECRGIFARSKPTQHRYGIREGGKCKLEEEKADDHS
jgi:hypothetical protein